MSMTAFSSHEPRQLVDETETPLGTLEYRYRRLGGLREQIRVFEKQIDEVIAEASLAGTPVTGGVPWVPVVFPVDLSDVSEAEQLRSRVAAAVSEIRTALALSEQRAARLVGVARNTLASWRRGDRTPYPASVRTLFEVHSIVAAADAFFGPEEAQRWFSAPSVGGAPRSERLFLPDGPRDVMGELRRALFPGGGSRLLPSGADLEEGEAPVEGAPGYHPDAFTGPIRRRRPIP